MWVLLHRAVGYKGQHLEANTVVEVDAVFGQRLIWLARAAPAPAPSAAPEIPATNPEAIETREPEPETRDPATTASAAPERRTRRGKP